MKSQLFSIPGTKLYSQSQGAPMEAIALTLSFIPLLERTATVFKRNLEDQKIANPELIPCYFKSIELNISRKLANPKLILPYSESQERPGADRELDMVLKGAIKTKSRIPELYHKAFNDKNLDEDTLKLGLRYSFECNDLILRKLLILRKFLIQDSRVSRIFEVATDRIKPDWIDIDINSAFQLWKSFKTAPSIRTNDPLVIKVLKHDHLDFFKHLFGHLRKKDTDWTISLPDLAAWEGAIKCFTWLKTDSDVQALYEQSERWFPLDECLGSACARGRNNIVEYILKQIKSSHTISGWNVYEGIRDAAGSGHENVIQTMLQDSRIIPSIEGNMILRSACRNGQGKVVKLLLADPRVARTYDSAEAIRAAQGHKEIVSLLKSHGNWKIAGNLAKITAVALSGIFLFHKMRQFFRR